MKRCRSEHVPSRLPRKKCKNHLDMRSFLSLFASKKSNAHDASSIVLNEKVNFVTDNDHLPSSTGVCEFCDNVLYLSTCDRCQRNICRNCSTLMYFKENTVARCLDCL
ncbi:hypothetical protein POMI540_3030 [Schizosaccharomyces pombe]|uniref:Uncharacterized protein C4H3.16 n=1 Tax=Schizosaccharomyces pombe (strain 972 / ATCC 24843) TaxID=284812 RepID=YAYG_SCHPO|nr:uncharacterized protein SPAC4H3.16 [Schizosaccharomyces pombe]G2TRN0.1 RecName: Full=Uncharacterized protein C4H3.16 [Schizosaccharomyces pombe 972h-]CCD31332.1 sequence orphan [Schizosaccharomyces pombe]|eukprot:NP_001343122.1 uncharacterized protein SPAC4H3.16 [Schizosaccharomyces pombe]